MTRSISPFWFSICFFSSPDAVLPFSSSSETASYFTCSVPKGVNHFLWTPPLEVQGAFITTGGWQLQTHGNKKYTLSTTFQQVFNP
jgi:hypothetical protein